MPIYLDEAMMGHDPAVLGFPHILVCMAFVLRTPTGLWGVHLETADCEDLVQAFANWAVTKQGLLMNSVTDVYACCNHDVRYVERTLVSWNVEVPKLIAKLNWHGPVHDFNTSVIAPMDGTYLEFRHGLTPQDPCKIFYDVNEGMDSGPTIMTPCNGGQANPSKYSYQTHGLAGFAIQRSHMTKASPFGIQGRLQELNFALRLRTVNL